MVIGYEMTKTIDNKEAENILGVAYRKYVRGYQQPQVYAARYTTVSGTMQFDLTQMGLYSEATAKAIILHEMGHVLGLVNMQENCGDCKSHLYTCSLALGEYRAIQAAQGSAKTCASLRIEDESTGLFNPGSPCYHWDEACFADAASSELMTALVENNKAQPISRVTVAALEDINPIDGYRVDYKNADPYPLPASRRLTSGFKHEVLVPLETVDLSRIIEDDHPLSD